MIRMIEPNIRKMTIAGHHRAQQDAPLGGGEHALDRGGEARGFAILLAERLDDLHRAEDFAGDRADIGDAVLAARRDRAHAAAEEGERPITTSGTPSSISPASLGDSANRIDDAGDADDEVAQRDRDDGSDDLLDDRRVDGDPRRDLGRAVLLEEAGREAQQVAVHRQADVGDGPLAEPGDEIEADRRRDRHHGDQHQQILEPAGEVAGRAGAAGEAFVDDQLEAVGDRPKSPPAATSRAMPAMAICPG